MAEDEFGLKEKVSKLPTTPGVYQFFDANGVIIYIGKAKNLKNRVSSYFVKTNQTSKTMVLVRKIRDLKYIVVNTEEDALLLENNLIKKYKPRYNILLKDDKTYPWICITKEAFPRVFTTRKFIRNGSEYFGPYTSAKYANTLISLIKSLYKLRTCNLSLNKSAVYSGKYKVCLEYHIGNCMGPCVGYVQEEEYMEYIAQIRKYFFRDRFYDSKNEGIYYFSSIRKGTGNEGGHRSIENSSNKIHDSKYLNKRYRCIFLLGR